MATLPVAPIATLNAWRNTTGGGESLAGQFIAAALAHYAAGDKRQATSALRLAAEFMCDADDPYYAHRMTFTRRQEAN